MVNIRAKLVVACAGALLAFPVLAAQPFDGSWRVSATAKSDDARCAARSVSLRIEEGNVRYAGLLPGLISGKVRGDGSLPGPLCVASKPLGWPGWDGPTSRQEYP